MTCQLTSVCPPGSWSKSSWDSEVRSGSVAGEGGVGNRATPVAAVMELGTEEREVANTEILAIAGIVR